MPKKAANAQADVVAGIDTRVQSLIAEIDSQVQQLEQRKQALLSAFGGGEAAPRRRGRPPVAGKAAVTATPKQRTRKPFSDETKQRLSESKKAYWAQKRAEKEKAAKAAKKAAKATAAASE